MISIAILITVFNRKEKTLQCLSDIEKQKYGTDYQIDTYITDGGSSDGTVEAVKESYPQTNIQVKDGLFWNRGMFSSWEMALASGIQYDFYVWLNDDVSLYSNCIVALLTSSHLKGDKAIIIGATVDSTTQSKQTYGGRIKGKGFPILDGALKKVDYFNGNIVLVPRRVYQILGNLDYYFKHSKGDFDYGQRAERAGIEVYQVGSALGVCDEHSSIERWRDPSISLINRLKHLYRPNGAPPNETFHLYKKTSITKACIHYLSSHIHCIFPSLLK